MADRILLAENDYDLREEYKDSLQKAGFEVVDVCDGDFLVDELRSRGRNYFDAIISDTEMIDVDGPKALSQALEEKAFDDSRTLVMAMSDDSEKEKEWRGIAHFSCFYDKARLSEGRIAERARICLNNFRTGGQWLRKI